MNTKELKSIFDSCKLEELSSKINEYRNSESKGIIKLCDTYDKKIDKYNKEIERLDKMHIYEDKYNNLEYICGIDEVGRGPLAGPVVAGAVILPDSSRILYLNDSKKMTQKQREDVCEKIKLEAIDAQVGIISPQIIDDINILQATYEAMRQAISKLKFKPDILLNDAVTIPKVQIKQVPIIHGDALSLSIAAASVYAKVYRDALMIEYDKLYPEYDFASNKGYGSAKHIEALKKYGPCPIHRNSFIKNFL